MGVEEGIGENSGAKKDFSFMLTENDSSTNKEDGSSSPNSHNDLMEHHMDGSKEIDFRKHLIAFSLCVILWYACPKRNNPAAPQGTPFVTSVSPF